MSFTLRAKRLLIGAATGALVLGLFPAGAAFAGQAEVCANAPDAGFTDVAAGGTHTANINCMAAYGVGQGRTDGSYGVFANLTRGQAATLFVNFALAATDGAIADEIDATVPVPFTDIAGTTHEANIQALYRLGLIQGTTATTFGPNAAITRGQFATILRNAHEAFGIDFEASPANQFSDVAGTTHAQAINQLAVAGIISGRADGTYAPNANVARGATATLLAASAGVLDDAGLWEADRLPAPSNQTFTVTSGAAVAVASGVDTRTYTAQVPAGERVRIELFAAANVATVGNQTLFLAGANNLAAAGANTGASIVSVNGATTTGQTADAVSTGTVTFTLRGLTAGTEIVPVVYSNPATTGNNALNLAVGTAAYRAPAESFGVGGSLFTVAAEAADQATTIGTVTAVNRDLNYFVTAEGTFFYGAADSFQYAGLINLTEAQFESILSVNDVIAGTYRRGSTASTFNVTTDVVAAPAQAPAPINGTQPAVAVAQTVDASGVRDDVVVTWSASQPNAVYDVYRSTDNTAAVTPATNTRIAEGLTATTFTALNEPTGAWYYKVIARSPLTNQVSTVLVSPQVTVPATAAAAPLAVVASVTANALPTADLGTGDAFKVVFDVDMAAPAAGATVTLQDADGTIVRLTNGSNATFSLNSSAETVATVSRPALRVLTVNVTGDPVVLQAGTAAGLQYGAGTSVTAATGIARVTDNVAWAAAGTDTLSITVTFVSATGVTADAQTNANVTITGTGFDAGATVSFSDPTITVNSVTVNSPTQITVNINSTAGTADGSVTITNTNGGTVTSGATAVVAAA